MKFFARVFIPFLLLAYITVETYLKLQNKSLCGEVGCKLAGELLKFDPLYLNYFGLVAVFMMMVVGARSIKSKFFEALYFMLLYSAIAFEATILGYQVLTNPEPCIFCLGIFSFLLVIALFSHIKHFIVILSAILAIYVALNILAITKNKAYITTSGNYLIQSETCSHCKKVKAYFKKNNIAYTAISTKEASARSFLKFVDTSSIPVLIIKDTLETQLITGDQKIIAHFETKNVPSVPITQEVLTPPPSQSTNVDLLGSGLSSDFLSAGGDDAGCAISIVETPSCEDDNASNTQ